MTQRGHRRSLSANTTFSRRTTTLGEKDFQNMKLGAPGVPTFTVVAVCRAGGQEESGETGRALDSLERRYRSLLHLKPHSIPAVFIQNCN